MIVYVFEDFANILFFLKIFQNDLKNIDKRKKINLCHLSNSKTYKGIKLCHFFYKVVSFFLINYQLKNKNLYLWIFTLKSDFYVKIGFLSYKSGLLCYKSGLLSYKSGLLSYKSGLLSYKSGLVSYKSKKKTIKLCHPIFMANFLWMNI